MARKIVALLVTLINETSCFDVNKAYVREVTGQPVQKA